MTLWITTLCAALVWIGQPASQPSPDRAAFDARLAAVDEAMGKIQDVRAEYKQTRRTPLLKKPLVSRGTLVTKGQSARWETKSPRASTMLVGPESVELLFPDDKLIEIYPAGDKGRDLAGAPLPRLGLLKSRFEIEPGSLKDLGASETNPKLLAVRLIPKSEELKAHVKSVEVLIDESVPAATKLILIDADGERTEVDFSGVKLNTGVTDKELVLEHPVGFKVSRPLEGGHGTSPPVPAADGTSAEESSPAPR
ncbi:MAG: LolA family protein [Phycisphaerales bacterium]